ncbi:MAG: GNAT family acetyltransferase [Bryobacteraceae bacterium]|nr:MAG: GNAT family acetyltransferase [Bryobacteraceae bacterium]
MQAWERNAANLAASLSFYGRVTQEPGLRLITSWVTHPVFNIALLDGPAPDPPGQESTELDRRIERAAAHYRALGRSWSFWICEHLVGPRTLRRLYRIFDAHGMSCIAEPPGMEIDELPPPRRPLPEIQIREAAETQARLDFADIVGQCFYIPPPLAHEVYDDPSRWGAPLEILVGYAGPRAVTCAAFMEAAGAIGIYSVGTLPGWRGKGYAEAIMRAGVGRLRRRGAQGPIVLQSSPSGFDLYRRLGFRRCTRYYVFSS